MKKLVDRRTRTRTSSKTLLSSRRFACSFASQPKSLVYADLNGSSKLIVAGLSRLGRRALIVHTPLDAVVRLQRASEEIEEAFVPLQPVRFDMAAFCAFLQDEYPGIKRIAFSEDESEREARSTLWLCQRKLLLAQAERRAALEEVLEDVIGPDDTKR